MLASSRDGSIEWLKSMSTSSAEKVLDVLLLFNESQRELTVDEICELIEVPRSSVYRYVRTLREKGFLEKGDAGGLRLGPRVLELARVARGRLDIADLALPVMQQIAQQTRETILLTRLSGSYAVCIERVEGPQTIRITFERGQIQPLHAGASSKILLAYMEEQRREEVLSRPLERFTEHTVTDPEELRAQLRAIRQQGYCVSESEVDIGARAVAVPILDKQGRLVAGLSIAGPVFRMDDTAVEWHIELLRAGAATIEARLAVAMS